MTALLWARFVFLALLGTVVGMSTWTAYRTNEDRANENRPNEDQQ